MSQTVKLNVAVLGALVALVVSIGGVLIGYGRHSERIDHNAEDIELLQERQQHLTSEIRAELRELNKRIDMYVQSRGSL